MTESTYWKYVKKTVSGGGEIRIPDNAIIIQEIPKENDGVRVIPKKNNQIEVWYRVPQFGDDEE